MEQLRASLKKSSTKTHFKRVDRFVDNIPSILEAYYTNEIESRGGTVIFDDETKRHLRKASTWLVSTTKPGLMLFGKVGNGKSTLARAIGRLIELVYASDGFRDRKVLQSVSALELAALAKDNPLKFQELKNSELLAIDDVGVEPSIVKSWGNEISPFTEIIYYRYEKQLFTILTSNLTVYDIGGRYGPRVADRFTEMFDFMAFNGDSYREQT